MCYKNFIILYFLNRISFKMNKILKVSNYYRKKINNHITCIEKYYLILKIYKF